MNSPSHESPNSGRALLKQLEQQFDVFRKGLPVAIGIDKEIVKRIPDIDRKMLRVALGIHTHSTRYLNALVKAKTRFDLEGNPAGEILEAHRILAADTVKARQKKIAEQRKEQERAALEEQERIKREEKLRLLTEKFTARR